MAEITFKENKIKTNGTLPRTGTKVPGFSLVSTNLEDVNLEQFSGKKIFNIFPSIDTPVCAMSVRGFNQRAGSMEGVTVLNISADLPFAHKRFCGAEGLEGVVSLSSFRSTFAKDYGVLMEDGPLRGLCARAVIVTNEENQVLYVEQVPDIGQEPDYEAALKAVS